uniref:Uncharacterized protein n=1 Tax=Chenopodium quinoa TaxID=63459 RepID=A0A803L5T8_CHEQI
MTVDTVVNGEGEKCGLDMRSSSCEDLPPASVGDGGCECNGDSKDDYVFINGSDAVSDDHVVVEGDGELNVSESNAVDFDRKVESGVDGSDQLENCNVSEGKLDNVGVVNGGESKSENGIIVDEERNCESGGAELEEEIKLKSEGLVESGDSNAIEGKVDVRVRDLEVSEERNPKSVMDEVEDMESDVEKGDNANVLPSLDDDDKTHILPNVDSGSDIVQNGTAVIEAEPQVPHSEIEEQQHDIVQNGTTVVEAEPQAPHSEIEEQQHDIVQNGTTVVEAEPQIPHSEIEEQLHLGQSEEHEIHANEPEKLKDDVRNLEVAKDNGISHIDEVTESEPVDGIITETESLEADTVHQSHPQEDSAEVDTQTPNGDVKAPDSEAGELLLDDEITEEQSADCQQQDLQPADSNELDLDKADVEVKEHSDLDLTGMSGSQSLNSVDSEAAVCEQQLSDYSECKDQDASTLTTESKDCQESQAVLDQSEGEVNQSNLELSASEVNGPVLNSSIPCEETTVESTPDVEGSLETSIVDIQPEQSHTPVNDHEQDSVHGERNAELIDSVAGGLESSVQEVFPEDQVAEETGLVDVNDKEISSEDVSFEKTVTDEATNPVEPKSATEAAIDEEGHDLDFSHIGDGISENEANIPNSSHDAESCLRHENNELTVPVGDEVDLLVPCDSDITEEQGSVDDGSYAVDNCISCSADDSSSQPKLEDTNDSLPYLVNGTKLEVEPVNAEVDGASKINSDSEDTLKPKISFGSFECVTPFSLNDNNNIHTDILNRSTETVTRHSDFAGDGFTSLNSEANGVCSTELNHDKTCAGVVSPEQNNVDKVSISNLEESGTDSVDGQNVNPDLVRRPFYYLIRLPRFDDVKLNEEVKLSEMEVHEKTRNRDVVRTEYQKRKAIHWDYKTNFEAARSEERAAHKLMLAKRREIDSAQSLINLARHATTVEDVDSQILTLERKIQHETLNLAEEKKLVRDIKLLNLQREQLAANSQRQQELQQALDQRVETEEKLKVFRKEWDALRDNYAKAEDNFKAAKKKYEEESAVLNDINARFKSADKVRQDAYIHFQTLKKQAYEQNKLFYGYKDAAKAANEYAVAGEKERLEQHCVNQVENFMERWNNNDEFRKEYIKRNMKSTLRRFRTLDGRSLGPDEEPPTLVDVPDNRVNTMAKNPKVNSVGTVPTLERDFPLVAKKVVEESSKKVIEQKNKNALAKKRVETSKVSLAEPSGRIETEEKKEEQKQLKKEEEHKQTKEEEELARKVEQKRKEEEAARLREQRKLEEKAKAQEALERKRRMAEKAQARAEFRARKEAEEKEKISEIEPAQLPESSPDTIREAEVTEKPVTVAKKSHKPALYTKQVKTTKSISSPPAPLRNRGKRRIPQWAWWLVVVVLAVALIFPLGNIDILGFIKLLASGSSH